MADKVGLATISKMFREAFGKPIAESAYGLWQRIFHSISNEDLEKAAWNLVRDRSQYMTGQVRPDEITRELLDMGIQIYHRRIDPAFEADVARQFPEAKGKPVSLAEFRKTNEEGAQAIDSYMRRE